MAGIMALGLVVFVILKPASADARIVTGLFMLAAAIARERA